MIVSFSQKEISDILVRVAAERVEGYEPTASNFHFYVGNNRQDCITCDILMERKKEIESCPTG